MKLTPETAEKINNYVCSSGKLPSTTGEARTLLRFWLSATGLVEDRWGNYALPPGKNGEPRRYQFGDKVLRLQWRSDSGWHNARSWPLMDAALLLIEAAAKATKKGFFCTSHEGDCRAVPEMGAVCAQERVLEQLEAKKGKRKASSSKAAERRKKEQELRDGPGFYVVWSGSGGRLADHERPFATVEEAIDLGRKKIWEAQTFGLGPLIVIESPSRQDAVRTMGHVWWRNGRYVGQPADPRQLRLAGMVSGRSWVRR